MLTIGSRNEADPEPRVDRYTGKLVWGRLKCWVAKY